MQAFIIACFFGALALASADAFAQVGFDRPGGDYSNFPVGSGDPAVCAARCEREARCRAWSFSYPTIIGPNAVCWLKARVTPRVKNDCCISGVKGAGVLGLRSGPIEFAIDRTGGDYRSFETADDPSGNTCAKVCEGENRCRTWTYVRPGYLGRAARCYLKDRLTPPRRKPCCVSGVVR